MKKVISVFMSVLITISAFLSVDLTVLAKEATVSDVGSDIEFPYEDADVYVADSIIKGMMDKEGNVHDDVISLNIALTHNYTYELIAEELVDDELLMFNSLYWQNIKKTLGADFISMANWEEELCVLLIIDYLNYYGQTEEFESNYVKNTVKFTETIYEGVMDYVADEYDSAKGPVNQILATMSVDEAKQLTEKWGFTKDIKKYTTLGNDIQTVATTAAQYYKNLTKALSVQRADEARIDFLKQLKIAGQSNTTFVNAVDKVIAMYESSYATLALGEGTRTMLNHGMSVLFSEAKKACPEAAAIIDGLKTYNEGLNWLFNSDDISENNLKLVLIYTIGNYAKSAVRSMRDAFTANPTKENAQAFISAYEGYLKYQEYASESTKGFVSSALFDGVFNQIKSWFTDKNIETYNDFIGYLNGNIDVCYSLERLVQQYYDLYYAIVDYDCSAFADDDSSGSENIPVTSVSFKQPEITLNSTDDICLIYADIYPSNATNKKVTYICSDESILSVPINGGFATQKGTGVVTVTATTEDGGYTATQTVYVGDYTTSEVTDTGTCGDNLQWTLYNNGTLVISGTGDMINYDYLSDVPWYKYRTLIKAVKIGNNVTSIGDYAFESCENITSIIIPENVTSIGFSAFVRCSSLKSIDIPASVTSFGNCIFWWCSNLEEITIGQNLLSVGQDPFYRCLNLKRIIVDQNNPKYESIDGSLYEKDSYATGNKINLVYYSRKDNTTFQVPKNVIRIYRYAFDGCENLETITLPEGLERIESDAFSGCCNLDKIVLPNSVTNIGNSVFRDCSNLSEVILSENIKEVSQNAFDGCISLQSVLLPSSVQTIEWAAFSECTNLKKIYLPSSLTKIVSYAFNNCTQLEEVYFSGSQKEWGNIQISTDGNECLEKADINYNFYYYPKRIQINKTSLNLIVGQNETLEATITPSNFNNIDILWESDNAGVATVENGEVVAVNIGIATISAKTSNGLIATCSVVVKPRPIEVTKIVLNKTNLSLNSCNSETLTATVYPENAANKTVTWTSSDNSVAKVENGKVTGISTGTATITAKTSNGLTATCTVTVTNVSWTLVDGTLTINGNGIIEESSFETRSDIKKVVIQNSITGIEDYAFYNCKNIESVVIGNGVKYIGYRAFLQCYKLKSVTLGNNVKTIDEGAFYNCPALSSISIPDSVTDIGNNAFYHCLNLKTISVSNNIERIGREVFYNTAFYNEDSNWVNNALYLNNYLVHVRDSISGNYLIKNGTICIADKVFSGYSNLTEVTIPDSVLYMGNWTFSDCTNLKKITIGKFVRSIGYDTFSGCVNLENITIPSSVKSIGDFAFFDCYKLSKIIIPNSVTEIGENAFSNCSNLSSVTIGNGISKIEYQTFNNCNNLETITFGNNLKTIGEKAFQDCSKLENLTIGNQVKTIGDYAFWDCSSLTTVYLDVCTIEIGEGAFGNCINIDDVYYEGSKSQWEKIYTESDNDNLLNANIHFKTLEQVDVTGISLNKKSSSLIVGQSESLIATVLPSDATDKSVIWNSSNTKVASVNNGEVVGISEGTSTITVTSANGKTDSCIITVFSNSNSLEVGDADLDGKVTIKDATQIQRHLAQLDTLDGIALSLADTDGSGKVSIVDATMIQKYLARLIDRFYQPSHISLNYNNTTLNVGEQQTLVATIYPTDAKNKTVSWTSSNTSVATVDSNGTVTAKSTGASTITAKTYNGKIAECTITVKEKTIEVTGINLISNGISLNEGNTYQMVATVMPENATNKDIIWSTNDASIATVNSSGKITAVSIGKTTIIAKASNGVTATCAVSVLPVQVSSISLSDTNEVLYLGFTHFLTATVKPDNANDKSLTWSSSDTSVVTVSSSGTVTAKGLGTATVTAKSSNGISASCVYTVKSMIEPESVEFSVERLTLTAGSSYDLSYSVLPSNADNKILTWSSSNDSWVSVNQNGKITAVKSGVTVTITAETVNGKKDTVIVDVVRKASEYGKYLSLGLKTDTGILPPAITPNNPSYSIIRGDDLYFISDIDSELYQGARLNMYVTSGSSGTYATYNFTLGAENAKYDYKTDKGYISISKYLNWHRGQYIRVYSEMILANGQVVKPANLGTDDAIYLYMHPSY